MNVVAPTVTVVDAQDRLEIGEQFRHRQKLLDQVSDHGCAPEAAADQHREAELPVCVTLQVQTDVMNLRGCAILLHACHGDLEFARQVGELRMQGGPLADDFAVGTRIIDFFRIDTGEVISRDVTNAVAAGLRMACICTVARSARMSGTSARRGQLSCRFWRVVKCPAAAIIAARDVGELGQLAAAEQAIRNGDMQHRRVALHIQSVAQPQRLELIVRQLTGKVPPRLVAEFRHALLDYRLVKLVVLIHALSL